MMARQNPEFKAVAEGQVFLIPLRDGRFLPFQILSQREASTLSVCGLIAFLYDSIEEARRAVARWQSADVVAEITIPTSRIRKPHPGTWPDLGKHRVVAKATLPGARLRMADRIREKLGAKNLGLQFASIGVLFDLAHACQGLAPWDGMADPAFYEQFVTATGQSRVRRVSRNGGGGA